MKLKDVQYIIFFVIIFSAIGCKNYKVIETDEYYLKFPVTTIEQNDINKDTTNIILTNQTEEYSVMIIRRNKNAFLSLNECVSKELNYFLDGKNTKNLVTRNTQISGYNAVVINGVNKFNTDNYFWSFAVISNKYYYYILRITSYKTDNSFNEFYNDQIIRSFHLK